MPVELECSTSGRRIKKIKYTTASLPFPRSGAAGYLQTWRKVFKPSIIEFGGNDCDPFGTNGGIKQPAVLLWNMIYPNFTRDVDPGTPGRAALIQIVCASTILCSNLNFLYQAGDLLIGWRSTMGKAGIQIVVQTLISEGVGQEEAVDATTYLL